MTPTQMRPRFTQQSSMSSTVSLPAKILNVADYFHADLHNLTATKLLLAPEP